jgi:hypothetical protein
MRFVLALVLLTVLAPVLAAQLANDTCETATPIGEGLVLGNNVQAQTDMPITTCGLEVYFMNDLWYRFDSNQKGRLTATFGCNGADFDTGLFVFRNGCSDLMNPGCNDDSCGLLSKIQVMTLPSLPPLIAVAGLADSGSFTLKVTVDRISQFVIAASKVGAGWGGFGGTLPGGGHDFGEAATLGDIDGDGLVDLAVGSPGDDTLGSDVGAIWILRLSPDATVLSEHKIWGPTIAQVLTGDVFGSSVAGLGDLDGDGTPDVAVGMPGDDDGAVNTGTVWILFLKPDSTVKSVAKISKLFGGFGGVLDAGDAFGSGLATVGDLDGDGVVELAVGAEGDDDGGAGAGAVWILFLQSDGSVKAWQKLSATSGGFPGPLAAGDRLGAGVGAAGDIDGDGVPDLLAGAPVAGGAGAFWTLLLDAEGTVRSGQMIGAGSGFPLPLVAGDELGASLCSMGDLDGDGVPDLAVGAPGRAHPGTQVIHGAVFQVFLSTDGTARDATLLTDPSSGSYFWGQDLGRSVASPGDVDGDGHTDLVIGGLSTFMTVFLDPDNAWTILPDGALEGANKFAPELRGEGSLQPGTPWSLELAIAARNSPAAFIAGFSAQFHPFKGGVLVPAPDLVISGFTTDIKGRIELSGLWPDGVPPGAQIWIQGWVADNGGIAGFAASNAVLATTP